MNAKDILMGIGRDYVISAVNQHEELKRRAESAEKELKQWTMWGVVEVAVRNPQVADYCKHWEGRAEAAERQRDELLKALEWAMGLIPGVRYISEGGYAGPKCGFCSGQYAFHANNNPLTHSEDCQWRIAQEAIAKIKRGAL